MNFNKYHVSKNLFDKTAEYTVGTTTYNYTISGLDPNKYYTCSTNFERISGVDTASIYFNGGNSASNGVWSNTPRTFKPDSNGEIVVYIRYSVSAGAPPIIDDVMAGTIWVMVNEGSTPQPYEPYSSEVWHDTPHYIHNTSTDTITTLPVDLYADGNNATVGISGNMEQSGTPTPSNPIQPSECGERTRNLFNLKEWAASITSVRGNGTLDVTGGVISVTSNELQDAYTSPYLNVTGVYKIPVNPSTQYRLQGSMSSNGNFIIFQNGTTATWTTFGVITTAADTTFLTIRFGVKSTEPLGSTATFENFMISEGASLKEYEPYGYKIPISSGGTTTPVYLGEVQTTRKIGKYVFTGEENVSRSVSVDRKVRMYYVISSAASLSPLYCTHFQDTAQGIAYPDIGKCNFNSVSNFIMGVDGTEFETADDFKTWLRTQYTNGNPLTVWYVLATEETGIVNEPLRKIGDYADTVSGITIPTTAGANSFDVLTTLKPSEVTVNYKGWHPVADVHERENGAWD